MMNEVKWFLLTTIVIYGFVGLMITDWLVNGY